MIAPITPEEREQAIQDALAIIRRNIPRYQGCCQNHSSLHGWYPTCKNDQWTTGFWPGELWLSWEFTHDDACKRSGEEAVDSFLERIIRKTAVDHHDMGFLYTPSCVAPFLLTGNGKAREAALLAADQLTTRFQKTGGFLQAWGVMGRKEDYRYIIDCLLNLPLLYWASEQTGENRYRDIALTHTATCLNHSFRNDFSTYHTFFMDPVTGEGVRGRDLPRLPLRFVLGTRAGMGHLWAGPRLQIHQGFQVTFPVRRCRPLLPVPSPRRYDSVLGSHVPIRRRTTGFLFSLHRRLRLVGNGSSARYRRL